MGTISCFSIYGLHHPETNELRYVGETTMTLRRRQRGHIDSARNPQARDLNYHRRNWIRSLLACGLEPDIRLIESVASAEQMHERERYWIAFYLTQGARLTNGNNTGGSGCAPGSTGAIATGDKTAKTYEGFIDPDGNPVIITNMKRFCDAHGLVRKSMMDVYHGRKLHHHGYRHERTAGQVPQNVKLWTGFIRPDGTRESPFWNLQLFCRQQHLSCTRMHGLVTGAYPNYKGWRYEELHE